MQGQQKPQTEVLMKTPLLELALCEDLGPNNRDATTELLFPASDRRYSAHIISKHPEPIIICGIDFAKQIFSRLSTSTFPLPQPLSRKRERGDIDCKKLSKQGRGDADCKIESPFTDGQICQPGQTLMTITGDAHILLKGERVVLNFLRHLCAIATLTAKYVACVKDTSLKILDTRKTTPGMRQLEKYAVQCGGGANHRMGLYDVIMIKDTHIDLLGGMA